MAFIHNRFATTEITVTIVYCGRDLLGYLSFIVSSRALIGIVLLIQYYNLYFSFEFDHFF